MADDWEQDDWEKEDFKPVLPGAAAAAPAATAAAAAPDAPPAFEDEDAEAEPEVKDYSIKPQPKKKVEKKYEKGDPVDEPLDDPIAEKLRRQRLEEEADFRSARDLFGGGGKALDDLLPKTLKDFEQFAEQLAGRYLLPHAANKNYKGLLKALARVAMEPLGVEEIKEVEQTVAGIRADKVKAAQAAAAAKKTKKTLNVGKSGLSAGLDDYVFDSAAGPDDEYDFM
ncbi:MAG: eukaryotic translation initiation factor 3-like protein [Monoraphidium minutum]|nr:MAG: eukaryotic translation initiation factor 3-like protein [Monoraphidium minutum]